MFRHPSFSVEPWSLTETSLDLDVLAQSESVFALSNGHIGLRGNLDEGEPYGLPGTYLNSVYELRPLPYAEAGFGYPESGETIVNVTNGKLIRLLVDDEPFDVRYGQLLSHRRVLDFRAGSLLREAEWRSPRGAEVRVVSTRLVSLVERAVAAIRYEVTALNTVVHLVVQSELVANEELPGRPAEDPRVSAILDQPLVSEESGAGDLFGVLVHRVRQSGLRLAAAMDHEVDGPDGWESNSEARADVARISIVCRLAPGEHLVLTKYLAYGWSAERSRPALHDQARGALMAARHTGWQGLVDDQRKFLDEFWSGFDVELEGDAEVQQAVRFSIFHLLQAAARAEKRPIAAKGLTGPGYDGHSFWDTEIYVLGLLGLALPGAVADALSWRHSILPAAQERARQFGLSGASFPWRTINGAECSAYWPAGTAAVHIGADIAYAVIRYLRVAADDVFEATEGLELLVETARMWRSLGHHHVDGTFRIDGVTGPDEYSALADNNVYTNVMAQLNLVAAADACARLPERAAALGVRDEEAASWRDAAKDMHLPFDARLGIHQQADGFTDHEKWDFEATGEDQYPLMLHFPYFQLYRKQVVKQADLVLAMQLRPEVFTPEQMDRNFDYYERITVRDSSLSACSQAVLAAQNGHLALAYGYVAESSLIDLHDIEHNTSDGLHMAALAGAWVAIVEGLGGLRIGESRLCFRPRLPENLHQLQFRLLYRGRRLRVSVAPTEARYRLLEGPDLPVWHYEDQLLLSGTEEVARPIAPMAPRPAPSPPKGREPSGSAG
jgi:alpha,alpha-trehalose phosphorylase